MEALERVDTIAAVATPPGRGGIGIVRISGPDTKAIAKSLLDTVPAPRRAHFTAFRDQFGQVLDHGLALFFSAPRSFTGEDVLELHGHGGPVVLDMVLAATLTAGARLARPGEFSERAFLNGKIDLLQAEAIADLIDSASQHAARAALRSLEGDFSRHITQIVAGITDLRVFIEAAIDFADEDIEFAPPRHLLEQLDQALQRCRTLLTSAQQGMVLRDGLTVVIAGQPNAGKSSLLNALTQSDTAIVTDIPGTTRDVLKHTITIDGLPIHIIDTAGLRDTLDVIEQQGVERARREMGRADRILLVIDDRFAESDQLTPLLTHSPMGIPCSLIRNKVDLTQRVAGESLAPDGMTTIAVSALTGAGLSALRDHLKACAGYQSTAEGTFLARRRHIDALTRAEQFLVRAHVQLQQQQRAPELIAEDLRQVQQALGEITGAFTSDDLLGAIFSRFCIGK